MTISESIQQIHQRIASHKATAEDITLIHVTKTRPVSHIVAMYEQGIRHFGENRIQELRTKAPQLAHLDITWHFIGNIQTNKIKYLMPNAQWIHSISSMKLLNAIEKQAQNHTNPSIKGLLQVNISHEPQKSGFNPAELPAILDRAKELNYVSIRGFMGMAENTTNTDSIRPSFAMLKQLQTTYQQQYPTLQLDQLSMGMSNDFEIALQEGATMIRIGRLLWQ